VAISLTDDKLQVARLYIHIYIYIYIYIYAAAIDNNLVMRHSKSSDIEIDGMRVENWKTACGVHLGWYRGAKETRSCASRDDIDLLAIIYK